MLFSYLSDLGLRYDLHLFKDSIEGHVTPHITQLARKEKYSCEQNKGEI